MKMRRIDHFVLTVSDLKRSRRFYHEVFDMPVIESQSSDAVVTLRCGHQLIRLQQADRDALKAAKPTVGSADFCMVARDDLDAIMHHFKSYDVDVIQGPVEKHGSEGAMQSIYLRDPDDNLVEVSVYKDK